MVATEASYWRLQEGPTSIEVEEKQEQVQEDENVGEGEKLAEQPETSHSSNHGHSNPARKSSLSRKLRGVGRKVMRFSLRSPKVFRTKRCTTTAGSESNSQKRRRTAAENNNHEEETTTAEDQPVVAEENSAGHQPVVSGPSLSPKHFTIEIENDNCQADLVRSLAFSRENDRLEEYILHGDFVCPDNMNVEIVKESNDEEDNEIDFYRPDNMHIEIVKDSSDKEDVEVVKESYDEEDERSIRTEQNLTDDSSSEGGSSAHLCENTANQSNDYMCEVCSIKATRSSELDTIQINPGQAGTNVEAIQINPEQEGDNCEAIQINPVQEGANGPWASPARPEEPEQSTVLAPEEPEQGTVLSPEKTEQGTDSQAIQINPVQERAHGPWAGPARPEEPEQSTVLAPEEPEQGTILSLEKPEQGTDPSPQGDQATTISTSGEANTLDPLPLENKSIADKSPSGDNNTDVGCMYDVQAPLWGELLTCVPMGSLMPPDKSCADLMADPGGPAATTLEPRHVSEPPLAWLGSPIDSALDDGDELLSPSHVEKQRTHSLISELQVGQPEGGELLPEEDGPFAPLPSESLDLDPNELARRQWQQQLRMSARRLMQEKEVVDDKEVPEDILENLRHISIEEKEETAKEVKMSDQSNHGLESESKVVLLSGKNGDVSPTARGGTPGLEVGEQETQEKVKNAQIEVPRNEDSPEANCGGDEKGTTQGGLTWKADFDNHIDDDFRFEAFFPDIEQREFEIAPEVGKATKVVEEETQDFNSVQENQDTATEDHLKRSATVESMSELAGENILDNHDCDRTSSNVGEADSVWLERMVRELEELPDPQEPKAMSEAKLSPPPPPPPEQPRLASQAGHIRSLSPELNGDRYSVEEETSVSAVTSHEDRYSVEEETTLTGPSPLMTEFATLVSKHNEFNHQKNVVDSREPIVLDGSEKKSARNNPPGKMYPTPEKTVEGGNAVQLTLMAPAIPLRGVLTTRESFSSRSRQSSRSGEQSRDYSSNRDSKEFASAEGMNSPEEEGEDDISKFDFTDDLQFQTRICTPPHPLRGVLALSMRERFKEGVSNVLPNPDVPCQEIYVEKAIVQNRAWNINIRSKKRVAFDLNEDTASVASMSTQGLSLATGTLNQDIFYGCAEGQVANAMWKPFDKIIDEYMKVSDESSHSSNSSASSIGYLGDLA